MKEKNIDEIIKLHLTNAKEEKDNLLMGYHLVRARSYLKEHYGNKYFHPFWKEYSELCLVMYRAHQGFKEGDYEVE